MPPATTCLPPACATRHALPEPRPRSLLPHAPTHPIYGPARYPGPNARSICALGLPAAPNSAPVRRSRGSRPGTAR
eukprot:4033014-Alexandrium_andersonii.AAC.1